MCQAQGAVANLEKGSRPTVASQRALNPKTDSSHSSEETEIKPAFYLAKKSPLQAFKMSLLLWE